MARRKKKARSVKQRPPVSTAAQATKKPRTDIPVDELGPAGVKGELHVLALFPNDRREDAERLHDDSERQFTVSARLSKVPPSTEEIKGDFGVEDGSSYFLVPSDAHALRIQSPQGVFDVKKNRFGEKSLVEFKCLATNVAEARRKFQLAVLPFLDLMAYLADSPIVVASARIEDHKNARTTIDYVSPYRKVTINPHISTIFPEMEPVYAMYREAKNSHSDFYKFLCYYKILEGLLGPVRAEIFVTAKNRGITLPRARDVVPESPHIPDDLKEHAGKSVRSFFDSVMTPRFRNAIAHFMTDDGTVLNMSSPDHIDSYSGILFISELCAREVIKNHEQLVQQLHANLAAPLVQQ
ncbi:hypothetical protein PQQ75_05410 [Paraburkholderia aspalathi]|uniref:methylamine utilization protein MauJ n=1 Tax=Paraburkholderia aspalathi TaxID=1324617 RepID=UPI0038B6DBB1